jgi:LPXTG-site transpeptidase (sortase) family protein
MIRGAVGYQLWGTGITTARAQSALAKELGNGFNEVPAELLSGDVESVIPPTVVDTSPADTTPADTTLADTTVVAIPESLPLTPAPTSASSDRVGTTKVAAPVSTVAKAPPTTKFGQELVSRKTSKQIPIKPGEAIGQLIIPRISVNKAVVEGTGVEALKKGPGHYKTTPFPGEEGNAAIACHRTTFGAPCFRLDELQPGDEIFVSRRDKSGQAQWFKYVVAQKQIVKPSQNGVLRRQPGRNTLTLTTCHPKYSDKLRLIVTADLKSEASESDLEPINADPLAEQYKAQLDAKNGVTTTGPTTSTPASTSAPSDSGSAPVEDSGPSTAPITQPISASTVAELPVIDTTTADATGDAPDDPTLGGDAPSGDASAVDEASTPTFGGERREGKTYKLWFFEGGSDPWMKSLLWAAVCGLIWFVAWFVAHRRKRMMARWAMYGVGFIVLFIPALYMCFEQVSRLLPEAV